MTARSLTSLSKWCLIVLWRRFVLGPWISCLFFATSQDSGVTVAQRSSQLTRNKSPLLALRGATACAAAHKRGNPWIVEQLQHWASELAFFSLDKWIDLLRAPGVQSFSTCHHLRPREDRQPNQMAGKFVPLLLQHSLEVSTPSEFC